MTESRRTFTIPPGFEAIRDSDGRATGEIRRILPPAVQQLLDLQKAAGLSDKELNSAVGYTSVLTGYRTGYSLPSFTALTNFADYFGYEIRLVPKEPQNDQE